MLPNRIGGGFERPALLGITVSTPALARRLAYSSPPIRPKRSFGRRWIPTRNAAITDTAREQVIPLLNDYSDAIFLAIHEHGGEVLKLIGDGTLAIFTAEDRMNACSAALSAAIAARRGVAESKKAAGGARKPVTEMYLGLHIMICQIGRH